MILVKQISQLCWTLELSAELKKKKRIKKKKKHAPHLGPFLELSESSGGTQFEAWSMVAGGTTASQTWVDVEKGSCPLHAPIPRETAVL